MNDSYYDSKFDNSARLLSATFTLIDTLEYCSIIMKNLKDNNSKLSYDEMQKQANILKRGLDLIIDNKKELLK
jgi:hypothetical protein